MTALVKALIVCHNGAVPQAPSGHNLKHLYKQLRGDIQTAISYMTIEFCNRKLINQVYTAEMFESDLERYSCAFMQARYWYERKKDMSAKEAGILFISSFSEALTFFVTKIDESGENEENKLNAVMFLKRVMSRNELRILRKCISPGKRRGSAA